MLNNSVMDVIRLPQMKTADLARARILVGFPDFLGVHPGVGPGARPC